MHVSATLKFWLTLKTDEYKAKKKKNTTKKIYADRMKTRLRDIYLIKMDSFVVPDLFLYMSIDARVCS